MTSTTSSQVPGRLISDPVEAPPTSLDPSAGPLGPESLLWRVGFPRTSLLLAGRALLLQVAHPTVGAGVRDFSTFRSEPWRRLDHTLTSLQVQLFGGPKATTEAQRLRRTHQSINGTGFSGETYRALEPTAWAWVHLSNGETMLRFHALFGQPLRRDDQTRYWADWCRAGRTLGIAARDLPSSIDALRAHVDEMVATTLGDNETVRAVLTTLALSDVAPPTAAFPASLWNALRPLGRFLLHDSTVGSLPPALRTKLGLEWTDEQERRLRRTATLVRTLSAGIPERALHYPMAYRAMKMARRSDTPN